MTTIALVLKRHAYIHTDALLWLRTLETVGLYVIGLAMLKSGAGIVSAGLPPVPPILFFATGAMMVFTARMASWKHRSYGRRRYEPMITESYLEDDRSRLVCYGEAEELLPLRCLMTDEIIEPIIIQGQRVPLSINDPNHALRRGLVLMTVICVPFFIMLLLVDKRLVLSIAMLCGLPLLVFSRFVGMRYYRVVAGQLDILEVSYPRLRLQQTHSLTLCESKVTCNYPDQFIQIQECCDGGSSILKIPLSSVRRPHLLAQALFQAASTQLTSPLPPLPENALLG